MTAGHPVDLGVTLAGVRLPFAAMNASGAWSSTTSELRALARSATGAIVTGSATVHRARRATCGGGLVSRVRGRFPSQGRNNANFFLGER